jgi:hypothetical protein
MQIYCLMYQLIYCLMYQLIYCLMYQLIPNQLTALYKQKDSGNKNSDVNKTKLNHIQWTPPASQTSLTYYTELDTAHNAHRVSVNTVPWHAETFLTSWGTFMFLRTILLHGVSCCIVLLEIWDSESPLAKDYWLSTSGTPQLSGHRH